MSPSDLSIEHRPELSRFQAIVGSETCVAAYRLGDDRVLRMTHTEVPPALQGRGIAARLVRYALDYARAQGLKVLPLCSYVRRYMQRHPETQELLA